MLLTPPGPAAIAVIRLIGPRTAEFLRAHFSKEPRAGRCVHGTLRDGEKEIDDPVVVLVSSDAADLNVHGGPWVVRSVLELARREGFGVIESSQPPTSLEGVDGGSLLEREVMANLCLARTKLGVRALLAQTGAWSEYRPKFERMYIVQRMLALQQIRADMSLWRLLHPPRVAIVGAVNVGKSTLANQLFGQERSITADVAGTTRDWIGEIADINGLPVMLVDTPGQRQTHDSIEQQAIEQSRAQISAADLVVLVLDANRALEPQQAPLLASYPDALVVLNKADQPRAFDASALHALETVATSGSGIAELRERIASFFGCASIDLHQPRCWTPRQRELIERAIEQPDRPDELFCRASVPTARRLSIRRRS